MGQRNGETNMTNLEAKAIFDNAIAAQSNPDIRAQVELAREYFFNEMFRTNLTNYVAAQV